LSGILGFNINSIVFNHTIIKTKTNIELID